MMCWAPTGLAGHDEDPIQRRRRRCLGVAVVALLIAAAACRAPDAELAALAEEPPLSFSVLLSGGAFIEPGDGHPPAADAYARTFADTAVDDEAFPLHDVLAALRAARVFVRLELDGGPQEQRRRLAVIGASVPVQDAELTALLEEARRRGHDYLLVVERLRDGSIEEKGINGQWPITVGAWLLVGLGMLIPDHDYESRTTLRVAMREVQTGERVFDAPLDAGIVDLSLVQRGSVWGIVSSILIPPFWVSTDPSSAAVAVRDRVRTQLLVTMARRLKSFEVAERLGEAAPARIELRRAGDEVDVGVVARESLSFVRLRLDGELYDRPAVVAFVVALLRSERASDDRFRYRARLAVPNSGSLQVLLQTVAGRVASVTVDLGELE